ncbi:hypothetical protein NPIL_399281, partial [Nephila pilipes]
MMLNIPPIQKHCFPSWYIQNPITPQQKMFFRSIQVLLSLALMAIGVSAKYGDDGFVLKVLDCISKSRLQSLCDGFLDCKQNFAQP